MALSYEDTVLSFNPVLFPRMDELSGTVLHDSSTFATHGTLYAPVFGIPSPIETDAGSSAMSDSVGKVLIADAPQSDIRDSFSLLVWGFIQDNSSQVSHLITRNGQIGLGGGNWLALDPGGGGVRFRVHVDGTDYEITYNPPIKDTFGFAAGVRNGTSMFLYWNAVLVASRSDLPASDIDVGGSLAWFFGSSANQNLWISAGIDEASIHPALNAGAILEIYESALNQLLLSGRSDVVVTASLNSQIEPDPVSFPFRHNWREILTERLSFSTGLSTSITGAEEGNEQRIAPRREFESTQLLRDNSERRKFRALLWKNQNSKWFVPVRQDAQQLSADLTAGATTIPLDTLYRDYEVGGYIGLRQTDSTGRIVHWEEKLITGATDTSIECPALSNSYSQRLAWVYPVKRAFVTNEVTVRGHTDSVEEATLTARLLVEDEAEVPHRIIPWAPTLKYRDHEVYDPLSWPSHNWDEIREYDVSRETSEVDFNVGLLEIESDTVGASESIPMRLLLEGREVIARFLGWFYERRGRSKYLWVPTMQEDFEVRSVSTNLLTVADTNYSDSFALAEPRRDLAFVYNDLTMKFRRVTGFSGSTNETLTLDANVPSLTNLRSVSLLKFCRLDGDQVELAWHTDDKVVVAFSFREMLHSPEGTGLSSLSPSASQSHSTSPSASLSSSSSVSLSRSPSQSVSPSESVSPSGSISPSVSPSHSASPSV